MHNDWSVNLIDHSSPPPPKCRGIRTSGRHVEVLNYAEVKFLCYYCYYVLLFIVTFVQAFTVVYVKQTMFLVCNIADILWVRLMAQVLTFPMINILYFYISTVELHFSGRWLSG